MPSTLPTSLSCRDILFIFLMHFEVLNLLLFFSFFVTLHCFKKQICFLLLNLFFRLFFYSNATKVAYVFVVFYSFFSIVETFCWFRLALESHFGFLILLSSYWVTSVYFLFGFFVSDLLLHSVSFAVAYFPRFFLITSLWLCSFPQPFSFAVRLHQ